MELQFILQLDFFILRFSIKKNKKKTMLGKNTASLHSVVFSILRNEVEVEEKKKFKTVVKKKEKEKHK